MGKNANSSGDKCTIQCVAAPQKTETATLKDGNIDAKASRKADAHDPIHYAVLHSQLPTAINSKGNYADATHSEFTDIHQQLDEFRIRLTSNLQCLFDDIRAQSLTSCSTASGVSTDDEGSVKTDGNDDMVDIEIEHHECEIKFKPIQTIETNPESGPAATAMDITVDVVRQ